MYFASHENCATDIWRLDAQEIAVPLKRATYSVVDFFNSLLPAQSVTIYISSLMWSRWPPE